jgi:hypothetical protein
MSIEGMRLAWLRLAPALDGFYERAGGPLMEGQRLDEQRFAVLDELVGPMIEASAAIRSEAESVLSETIGEDYASASELLLAAATLDVVLACDLAVLEPVQEPKSASPPSASAPSFSDVFDLWSLERSMREAEAPSPLEVFAEGQEAVGQVAVLFDAIPAVGGGEHRPRSRAALLGDTRDAVVNLVALAESPGSELVKGFFAGAGAGIGAVIDAAARGDALSKLRVDTDAIIGRSPRFLREHVAKLVSLCPESWFVDEATSAVASRLSVRKMLERVAEADVAVERSGQWIESAPQLRWPAIDNLRRDLDGLEGRYRKQTKLIRKSARILRFGAVPLSGVACATLGPAGLAVVPGVFALGTGYIAYSLTDRLDARDLGVLDLVEGVVRLVEARIDQPNRTEPSQPKSTEPSTSKDRTAERQRKDETAKRQEALRGKAREKKMKGPRRS